MLINVANIRARLEDGLAFGVNGFCNYFFKVIKLSAAFALFWLALKAKDLPGNIESSYLPLRQSPSQIQSRWVVGIQVERPNPLLICLGTESLFLFYSRYHLQRLWNCWGSSRENLWIPAKSLIQLCCGVVYFGVIAGWPIYTETKLQIEFCSIFWPRRFQNGPCTSGRTNSNPCANYYNRGLKTKPRRAVFVVPMMKAPSGSGSAVSLKQTILEPVWWLYTGSH